MKILAIDTSCDETSAAVVEGTKVWSNVVWSQASLHAQWGGVLPSLAQRQHEERIDWVIAKTLKMAQMELQDIGAIAVTIGPGLAIALGVGIKKAKELAEQLGVPLLGINHIEGHLLSSLARPKTVIDSGMNLRPEEVLGLVVSGAHTEIIAIEEIGKYKILAETQDDALGEAFDKAARMLGLGYPGGAILEKMAREGDPAKYSLPLPMRDAGQEMKFSYSGLKSAMWRLVDSLGANLTKQQIYDLAATFQDMALRHLMRIFQQVLKKYPTKQIWVGGGVAANGELRKRLRKLGREMRIVIKFPYSLKLCGDNAAMIGVVAGFRIARGELKDDIDLIDRIPRLRIDAGVEVEYT